MNSFAETLSGTLIGEAFAFLLGLIWGSFFNVLILRLPAEEPIGTSRSRCPKCLAPIPWYLNIPLFSYAWLRGKCRNCKVGISLLYPLVELGTGLMFLSLNVAYGWSTDFLFYTVFASILLVISVIDIHHQIIPDELSLPGIVLGFLLSLLLGKLAWWESTLGVVFGGGVFLSVAYGYEKFTGREGLGGGDIKLLAMIGAWLGYQSLLVVIVLSSAVGSVAGVALMAVKRRDFKTAIPFGPFLALAALIYVFWGKAIQHVLLPDFSPLP